MINNKFNLKKSVAILIGLMLSFQAYSGPSKKNILKINNSLIFDLFLNYELAEKNGNLAAIIDFLPNLNNVNYKSIRLTSNIGGENQICNFTFNEKGTIEKIGYEVNDKIYRYDFIYKDAQLTGINIADKPKISFGYDKKGRIITITREKSGGAYEYNFEYPDGENKTNIKLIVVQGEKRSPSIRKYYAIWDSELKLESYCFHVYCSKNIKYNSQGDLLSCSFANVNEDNNIMTWNYSTTDTNQNWTERKSKNIAFNRTFEY